MCSKTLWYVLILLLAVNLTVEIQNEEAGNLTVETQNEEAVNQTVETQKEGEVIYLQYLLRKVSDALESCSVQLKASRACGCREQQTVAEDCSELLASGEKRSGVYSVQPLGYEEPFDVFCDMTTDGGGWTVIQRRGDYGYPVDYFYKTWTEYKAGFGNLHREFWLGNDKIAALSQQRNYALRVDLTTMDRRRTYAAYRTFWVDNEANQYQLHISDYNGGEAKDSLIMMHSGQNFSTKDRGPSSTCANTFKGGWWYSKCHSSNLNGLNLKGETTTYADGIVWDSFTGHYYSLYSEMKIK